jgi:hypothetical protein
MEADDLLDETRGDAPGRGGSPGVASSSSEAARRTVASRIRRIGNGRAMSILFAAYVTGQTLIVDGGLTVAPRA